MTKEVITISKEDYLKAILEAESEGQTVISSTLAHWLSVSPPAVTMALKRLKRDGYVEVKPDGIVRLTPKGKETAYHTARRHHLIERMLSEMFGMDWYRVHDEAERLEHAVSPAFEAKLIEKLGEKGMCPHGNSLLPESPEQLRKRGLVPLFDASGKRALHGFLPARTRPQTADFSSPFRHRPQCTRPAQGAKLR